MHTPLTKWYCDICDEVIEDIAKGYVVWKNNDDRRDYSFRIIHQSKCDPRDVYPCSSALEDFVGPDGLSNLLANLSLGPFKNRAGDMETGVVDMNEYVDFIRRVQLPYYEEARRYFDEEDLVDRMSDANELYPYRVEQLRAIIEEYEARLS